MGRKKVRETGTAFIFHPEKGGCVGDKDGNCFGSCGFKDVRARMRTNIQFINKSTCKIEGHVYKITKYDVNENGLSLNIKRKD